MGTEGPVAWAESGPGGSFAGRDANRPHPQPPLSRPAARALEPAVPGDLPESLLLAQCANVTVPVTPKEPLDA